LEWFGHFLERAPFLREARAEHISSAAMWIIMITSVAVALAGLGVAWWMYGLRPGLAARLAASARDLYQASLNKFYLDELYDFFIVQPVVGFATFCRIFDQYVVDGIVDLIGHLPRLFGLLFRPIQNGLTQFYALAMALGLTVFLVALVWRYAF
jgi:NADH-quinone oxidoreductase subunit L